jgi:hypothetical protein
MAGVLIQLFGADVEVGIRLRDAEQIGQRAGGELAQVAQSVRSPRRYSAT